MRLEKIPSETSVSLATRRMFYSQEQLEDYANSKRLRTMEVSPGDDTIFYVVQKCSHGGGGQHFPPQDMLRLFHSQREAEEAAYHSAMVYARSFGQSSLKTLLLPSYRFQGSSSYGFLARENLFWVRPLRATIVTANTNSMCHSAVYAILTEGVIGWTGQRGKEVCDGRVFGGDASARAIAQQAVQRVSESHPSLKVEAKVVSVGKTTPDWYSSLAFLKDWQQPIAPLPTSACPPRTLVLKRTEDFPPPISKRRRLVSVTEDPLGLSPSVTVTSMDEDTSSDDHHDTFDYFGATAVLAHDDEEDDRNMML